MKTLRLIAVVLGLALMIGEGYRSWGVGRPITAWLDDFLLGGLLIVSAWFLRRETPPRRALFSGAWGMTVAGMYMSFFSKVFEPALTNPGNMPLGLLTALIGVAFAISTACFIASLTLPFKTN